MTWEIAASVVTVATAVAALLGLMVRSIRRKTHRKAVTSAPRLVSTQRPINGLRFGTPADCAVALLRYVWDFPEMTPQRGCWAVKESSVLKGDLKGAMEKPGLGIALFVVDLAREAFGECSSPKIANCIRWGVKRLSTRFVPPLIPSVDSQEATGSDHEQGDVRHTVALAILMARSGSSFDLQEGYLAYLLRAQGPEGAWSATLGSSEDDLPTVTYAVEFLSLCRTEFPESLQAIQAAIGRARTWVSGSCTPDGGWVYTSFSDKDWRRLWMTSFTLARLRAVDLGPDSEWESMAVRAANVILEDATHVHYSDDLTQVRVEARAAAALAAMQQSVAASTPLGRSMAVWLRLWRERFLHALAGHSWQEMDLATATFAVRGLVDRDALRGLGSRALAQQAEQANAAGGPVAHG